MKNCRKCNIELIEGTRFNSDVKQGISICKSCRKKRTTKHYTSNKESYNKRSTEQYEKAKHDSLVYLLEDYNYVGVTENLKWRMSQHRYLGKSTDRLRILHTTKDREEALELESLLHALGYEGQQFK